MNKKALGTIALAFLLVAGCSNNETLNEPKQEINQNQEQGSEIQQNEELTKQVKDEEGVLVAELICSKPNSIVYE